MLRYSLAALALKTFSINSTTRKLYRRLGNRVGAARRENVPDLNVRVARGDLLVELARKHHALQNGDRMLEIGTGWMHWFSLYASFFFDLRITGLDVWDNRQFSALQAALRKVRPVLVGRGEGSDVIARLDRLSQAQGFDDLYARIGFQYVIEPQGSLAGFADQSFDSVISFHVLEHVPKDNVDSLLRHMHRVLRPGGCVIHQIGIDDHLAHYDKKASGKQYLKYSDRTWRTFFDNKLQYINRIQASEWQRRFAANGFQLVDRIAEIRNVEKLPIHPQYRHLPREDFGCTILTLVYRKPAH